MPEFVHEFDAKKYLSELERGRDITPEQEQELIEEERNIKISSLINEAYDKVEKGEKRVDIESDTHKIVAYKIPTQNLIRIDVRKR